MKERIRPIGFLTMLVWLAVWAVPAAGSDPDDPFDSDLDLEFEMLQEEQVVTATKQRQTVSEAPSIISVITRKELKCGNYRSVGEALASIPGVFVNYDYVFYDVGLRGISGELRGGSRLIKVMIDGQSVSFRSETTNLMGPELIPIDAVERIEVIRGPGSALYGANAFLGVVNIITRRGEKTDAVKVRANGSLFQEAYGGMDVGILAGKKLGPFDVLLAVSHSKKERSGLSIRCTTAIAGEQACEDVTSITERLLDRSSFDDFEQPTSMLLKLHFGLNELLKLEDLPDLGRISLLGSHQLIDSRGSFSDWGSLNYDHITDQSGNITGRLPSSGNRVALYNGVFRGRYDLSLFENLLEIALGAAYARGGASDNEHLKEVTGPVSRAQYGFEGTDLFLELSLTPLKDAWNFGEEGQQWAAINHLGLRAGVDYSRNEITYISAAGVSTGSYSTSPLSNIGVWSQLTGTLLDARLSLVAGLRYDNHNGAELAQEALDLLDQAELDRLCDGRVCYDQLSTRVGATLVALREIHSLGEDRGFVLDSLFVKALWGTAFKAPSPVFLYNHDLLGERPLNPNPALLPQKVESLELLLGARMLGKRLDLSVTFFTNHLDDKAEFSRRGLAVVAINGADVDTWGLEGDLRLRLHPVTVFGNLSYQNSRRKLGENLDRRIEDTFGYPDWMASLGLSVVIESLNLVAGAEARYVGERTGHFFNRTDRLQEQYHLDPYLLVDLHLTSQGWKAIDGKETCLGLSVQNLLNTRYDFPGFQPYYRYDIPGIPRTILLTLSQEF